jgi:hypothetical protein
VSISTLKNILVDCWEGECEGDWLGFSVSISDDGNTALVGASGVKGRAGAAYLFVKEGSEWSRVGKLTASNGDDGDQFGRSVALSGDGTTALVGAFYDNDRTGAAYIFTKPASGWANTDASIILTASDGACRDRFGWDVALSRDGDIALIGAYGKTVNGFKAAGGAYIFTRSGDSWTQVAALTATDAGAYNYFGDSVALDSNGDTVLVSAYGENDYVGVAYIYARDDSGWSLTAKLTASDGGKNDQFGQSVALSGDGNTALIGSIYNDIGGCTGVGAAYIFTKSNDGWSTGVKLTTSEPGAYDYFGGSVALSGDGSTALVEAFYKPDQTGVVYIFTRPADGWTDTSSDVIMTANYGIAVDKFSLSTAISHDGSTALVGAPNPGRRLIDSGAVYVFN